MSEFDQNEFKPSVDIGELSARVSRTIASLREWHKLHTIGYFNDMTDEQKQQVTQVAERTKEVLAEWGIVQ